MIEESLAEQAVLRGFLFSQITRYKTFGFH
jgi:hypothetical protein